MHIDYENTLARLGDDRELYQEFIQIFRQDAPPHLEALRNGLARNEARTVGQAAHAIKGLAASLGATEVATAAQSLEGMGRSGNLQEAAPTFKYLLTAIDELESELNRIEHEQLH